MKKQNQGQTVVVALSNYSNCFYTVCKYLYLNRKASSSILYTNSSALHQHNRWQCAGRKVQANRARGFLYRRKLIKCTLLYISDHISDFLEVLSGEIVTILEQRILSFEKLYQNHPQSLSKLVLKCSYLTCQKHPFLHSSPNLPLVAP